MHPVIMSPNVALSRWRSGKLSIEQVMSHTAARSFHELYEAEKDDLANESAARELRAVSRDDHEIDEHLDEIWDRWGDFLREMVPPGEYQYEIKRLISVIQAEQRNVVAARMRRQ